MLGASGVGKTSIVNRFINDEFSDTQSTVYLDFTACAVTTDDGEDMTLAICDTAGQLRYQSILPEHIQLADVILICHSLHQDGDVEIEKYYELCRSSTRRDIRILIVVTKCDLLEDVGIDVDTMEQTHTTEDGECMRILYTSAKTGYGVNELFSDAVELSLTVTDRPIGDGIRLSDLSRSGVAGGYGYSGDRMDIKDSDRSGCCGCFR